MPKGWSWIPSCPFAQLKEYDHNFRAVRKKAASRKIDKNKNLTVSKKAREWYAEKRVCKRAQITKWILANNSFFKVLCSSVERFLLLLANLRPLQISVSREASQVSNKKTMQKHKLFLIKPNLLLSRRVVFPLPFKLGFNGRFFFDFVYTGWRVVHEGKSQTRFFVTQKRSEIYKLFRLKILSIFFE